MESLASWVQRRVARPVLRALGGDVLQQWSNAPSFDPISMNWTTLWNPSDLNLSKHARDWRRKQGKGNYLYVRYADDVRHIT